MTESKPLLDVIDLCKGFAKHGEQTSAGGKPVAAVDRVSFRIPVAGIYGLVGESGSGKSTIARLLMQLIKADGGQVLLNGQDMTRFSANALLASRKQMQIVFQDSLAALSPRRSIRQTLLEPLEWHRVGDAQQRQQRLQEVLETVGISDDCLPRFPHQLSGGQRQRICLARALILKPQLVIADEALSALDVSVQARIITLLHRLRDEQGIAFLLISHDLAVIRQLADSVGVLYRGQLVEQATADDLFDNPSHPYTRMLLNAVPSPEPGQNPAWTEPPRSGTAPAGACLFSHRCSKAVTACTQIEPLVHAVTTATVPHQVKCHLHDPTQNQ
jgi:oligopeptide/dipeptide ABC transporter ATP-binding protein